MQKILAVLVSMFFIVSATDTHAQQIILDLKDEVLQKEMTIKNVSEELFEAGRFFHEKYLDEKIDGPLTEDVRKLFPNLEDEELAKQEESIRNTVKIYRYGKYLYDDIKLRIALPDEPILPTEPIAPIDTSYIESDEPVILSDFENKIDNPLLRKEENWKDYVVKLGKMFSKIDFKRLLLEGPLYEAPAQGSDGIGKWMGGVKDKDVSVRLLSEYDFINDQKTFQAAFEFNLPPYLAVLALSPGRPIIDFSQSKNLESYTVFHPVPARHESINGEDIIGYVKNFAIPLELTVLDVSKPLELEALVVVTLCSPTDCRTAEIRPILTILPGAGESSLVSTFIRQAFYHLPQEESEAVKVIGLVVDERFEEGKDVLRLILETKTKAHKVDVFIENAHGIILSSPKISIDDKKITARMSVKDETIRLNGRDWTFIVSIDNNKYSIRQTQTASSSDLLDMFDKRLSMHLLFLAFLGGIILNFMPCVFPVLSLKLLAMSQFGAGRNNAYRKNFLFTVAGIFLSFAVIATFLSGLKFFGQEIGWGMQFQSPTFLVCMIFVMAFFAAYIFGWVHFSLPYRPSNQDNESFKGILTGVLLVLVATPCTAPFLGTAIGFALAGSIIDIYSVMSAVALGLSLPYLAIAFLPRFSEFLPKPGPWMMKLHIAMVIALILTIIWLISVLGGQASFWFSFRMALYVLLFWFILWFRRQVFDAIDKDFMRLDLRLKTLRIFTLIFGAGILIIFLVSWFDIQWNINRRIEQNLTEKIQRINTTEINNYLREGKTLIVAIEADWCLTCSYNNFLVFKNPAIKNALKKHDVKIINVDWTNYDREVLQFLERFGRKGLPFYILFSPKFPEGFVLPELLDRQEIIRLIAEK